MRRFVVFYGLLLAPLAAIEAKPPQTDMVDRLARRLQRETHDLRIEVLVHFKGRPGFADMEGHTERIEMQAMRITKLAGVDARPRMIRDACDKIDDEMRHIQRHLNEWGRTPGIDRKAFDHLRDELNDIGTVLYRIRRELY